LKHLLTILGPTASGKTELACHLALQIKGEIISADSRQVYRDMDIGTGKDIEEYTIEGTKIPYHLIDIKPAGYKYNIWEFQSDFLKAFSEISEKGNQPILCGGSGLYLETALKGNSFLGIPNDDDIRNITRDMPMAELLLLWREMPSELQHKLDNSTDKRIIRGLEIAKFINDNPYWKAPVYPDIEHTIIGLDIARELRREKITKRLSYRLNHGMIEEVQSLHSIGLSYDDLSYYGLEYKFICLYLQNKISKRELFEGLNIAIHQFSKRQMTWFRRMEKQGYKIEWIDAKLTLEEKLNTSINIIKKAAIKN
jgi:tRNA dimethylallyltransferase